MQSIYRTMLQRFAHIGVVACLVSGLAWQKSGATEPITRPHDGLVANGTYTNKYFDLSYPLPSGGEEGLAGPRPSQFGYYVLSTLVSAGEDTWMVLITAQDTFFGAKAVNNASAMARGLGNTLSEIDGMTIDQPLSEVTVAGRRFSRIDFSGVGLFHSTWVTDIRCHLVSFNITTNNPDLLATLVLSLNNLGAARAGDSGDPDPVCMKDQADTRNIMTRVDPPAIAPFMPIPVRLIIGADGGVKHVNVIRATDDQRNAIETALGKWKFKPPETQDSRGDIETGLVVESTPEGHVKYSAGGRMR